MTPEEAMRHLTGTFDHAAKYWPDVMEPYVNRLADAHSEDARKEIMRAGLRETVAARYDR